MKKQLLLLGAITILIVIFFLLTGCNNNEENAKTQPNSLSSVVKIGDYVDYKTLADNKYTSTKEKTGYNADQTFITTGKEKWRVLNIQEDGTVILISEEQLKTNQNNTYYLLGVNGYTNACEELNNISSIYGNGEHAVNARHLNREDINNLIGIENLARFYDVNIFEYNTNEEKWNAIYMAMDKDYGKELTINSSQNNQQFKIDLNSNSGKTETDMAKETINYYKIKFSNFEENNKIYQELLNGRYWLANQIIQYSSGSTLAGKYEYFNYGVGYLSSSSSSNGKFGIDAGYDSVSLVCSGNYTTDSSLTNYNRYIRPVVILDKDTESNGGTGTSEDPFILK